MQAFRRRAALGASAVFTVLAVILIMMGEAALPAALTVLIKGLAVIAVLVQAALLFSGGGGGEFRTAVEAETFRGSKDAIFVLDGPRIVECNDATIQMLRASSREQVLRLMPPDFSPETQPDGRPSGEAAMELIGAALKSGFSRFEWMHNRLDGQPLPCSVTLVAVTILGKPYLMVFLHDISDLITAREGERHAAAGRRQMLDHLAASFEDRVKGIVTSVASSIAQLQSTAESLASSADESTHGLGAVSSATGDAIGGMETVASASTQLASSIQEISQRVSQSAAITREAAQEAQSTNTTIEGLSEAAHKIGEIVGLITDIAAQTNLLALNATIEAARAGEAGKGFAVVANEVKHLANQTAKATEDISRQISSIQTQTKGAVDAIRHIGATISHIDEMAAAIAAAVEEQGAATSEIARNVDAAAGGTRRVADNLDHVAQSAQRTESMAHQVATVVHALFDGSGKLESEVQNFLSEVRSS
ncbi:conserved membrane hypothetical protein [Candidatus Terasakiella magnetica]|nr:conserved membrane hypothetical protein [Candidatus Terasakiella magnetica]